MITGPSLEEPLPEGTRPSSTGKGEKSTPREVALEILGYMSGAKARLEFADPALIYPGSLDRETGELRDPRRTLDPETAARTAVERLEACGTFPRGKITLTWSDRTTLELGAHQCRHRLCPRCAKRRGYQLADEMGRTLKLVESWGWTADRVRFATLTVPNVESVAEGLDQLAEAWHRTLATKTWGRLIAGGFRAFEVKPGRDGKWNAHLHAILFLWTPGVPYALLREAWNRAAGGNFNQQFDQLRGKARPRKGESKAAAAARYLVKYLVKHEDLKNARNAPGGVPHLLASLEGRRMFSAFGLGAAARRLERHERPNWTRSYNRHLEGYHHQGERPDAATLELVTGRRERIEIPLPPLPAQFREAPDALEPNETGAWTVREKKVRNPLEVHPWRKLPTAIRHTKEEHESALDRWIANPRSRGPRPFRWRLWWKDAPGRWTEAARALMGERIEAPNIGAMLWANMENPNDRFPRDPRHPESLQALMGYAVANARRTARELLANARTPEDRAKVLARLPADLSAHLMEPCHHERHEANPAPTPWDALEPWNH